MKATFTPVFNRKGKLNHKGKAVIEIRAYQNRSRRFFSTGIFITPTQWDEKNQEINLRKHQGANELNFQIKEQINKLERLQVADLVKQKPFSIQAIQTKKVGVNGGSFTEFVKNEIKVSATLKVRTKFNQSCAPNNLWSSF